MIKNDWQLNEVKALYTQPFMDLLFDAQTIHRKHFNQNHIDLCTILSIKTGRCPEDCAYCSQSGHYKSDIDVEKLFDVEEVVKNAKAAKALGATRFCMGAAWRTPPKKDLPKVIEMIKAVKAQGLETCVTLGMLDAEQAETLKAAGLDYYNHNLDTSPEFYKTIISTHSFEDRLNTLEAVRNSDIKVCSGGIISMGETQEDRINLLISLANLPKHPESVPINHLMPMKNTPLEDANKIDNFEFIRTVAVARIMMPQSIVRLSAGRTDMSEEMQALCFMAGANSVFYGDKLLTAGNPDTQKDLIFFEKLGIKFIKPHAKLTHNDEHSDKAQTETTTH